MRHITLLFISFLFAACSAAGASNDPLVVDGAWGRPAPASSNSAFFMTLTNNSAENITLTAVETAACGRTELHISTMTDGVMSMRPMSDGIDVPAGETVTLEPGGLHVMCLDKPSALEAGDEAQLHLRFEGADDVMISAEIKE